MSCPPAARRVFAGAPSRRQDTCGCRAGQRISGAAEPRLRPRWAALHEHHRDQPAVRRPRLILPEADARLRVPACRAAVLAGRRASMQTSGSGGAFRLPVLALIAALAVSGCEVRSRSERADRRRADKAEAPYQAAVEEGVGAAVAILVDTSGSMRTMPGDARPKPCVARRRSNDARRDRRVLLRQTTDFPIKIGIYQFFAVTSAAAADAPYDDHQIRGALHTRCRGPASVPPSAMRCVGTPGTLPRGCLPEVSVLVVTNGSTPRGRSPDTSRATSFARAAAPCRSIRRLRHQPGEVRLPDEEVRGDVVGAGTGPGTTDSARRGLQRVRRARPRPNAGPTQMDAAELTPADGSELNDFTAVHGDPPSSEQARIRFVAHATYRRCAAEEHDRGCESSGSAFIARIDIANVYRKTDPMAVQVPSPDRIKQLAEPAGLDSVGAWSTDHPSGLRRKTTSRSSKPKPRPTSRPAVGRRRQVRSSSGRQTGARRQR